MAPDIMDILSASVVLVGTDLLTDESAASAFCSQWEATLELATIAGPARMSPVRRFVIDRDRMELSVGEDRRVQAVVEYPRDFDDATRVCRLMSSAIMLTESGASLASYGCNVALVYEQQSGLSAFQYLGKALYTDVADVTGIDELLGGVSAEIKLRCSDGGLLTVTLEPRRKDLETERVYLQANYHINDCGDLPPSLGAMEEAMDRLQSHVRAVIGAVDLRASGSA